MDVYRMTASLYELPLEPVIVEALFFVVSPMGEADAYRTCPLHAQLFSTHQQQQFKLLRRTEAC